MGQGGFQPGRTRRPAKVKSILLTATRKEILLVSEVEVLPEMIHAADGTVNITNTYASGAHSNAGGVLGSIRNDFSGKITVKYSVYNGSDTDRSIVGLDPGNNLGDNTTTEIGNSDNLEDIRGQRYHYNGAQQWGNETWVIHGTDEIPILRFQLQQTLTCRIPTATNITTATLKPRQPTSTTSPTATLSPSPTPTVTPSNVKLVNASKVISSGCAEKEPFNCGTTISDPNVDFNEADANSSSGELQVSVQSVRGEPPSIQTKCVDDGELQKQETLYFGCRKQFR